MQTLPFQQNTGFNTGALIKRNQQREADHDAIRSAVRAWAAAEGQDVVSAHIIDEWRQQGGEEIAFPDDISRARQKLFRYPRQPCRFWSAIASTFAFLPRQSWPFFRWNIATVYCPKTVLCPVWLVWKRNQRSKGCRCYGGTTPSEAERTERGNSRDVPDRSGVNSATDGHCHFNAGGDVMLEFRR